MEKKTVVVIKTENSFDITEHAYSIPKFEFDSDIKSLQMQEEMANLAASTITNTTDIKIEPIEDEIEEDQPELIQLADVVKEESYLIDEEVSIKDESDNKNHRHKTEAKREPYQSSLCDFQAFCQLEMQQHKKEAHSIEDFNCKKCLYKTENHNMSYEKNKGEEKTYRCDECEFRTAMDTLLDQNLWKQPEVPKICRPVNQIVLQPQENPSVLFVFECNKCKFKTNGKWLFLQHLKSQHQPKYYACDLCNYETTELKLLQNHIKEKHNIQLQQQHQQRSMIPSTETTTKNNFNDKQTKQQQQKLTAAKCEFCDFYTTFYPKVLNQHRMRHVLPNGMFKCHLCHQVVKSVKTLLSHVSRYHKVKYPVIQRGKKGTLYHENISSIKIPSYNCRYFCHLCPFNSELTSVLTRHMSKHIMQKNETTATSTTVAAGKSLLKTLHNCHICDRSFYNRRVFLDHVKTHWNRNYKCHFCPYLCEYQLDICMHVQLNHQSDYTHEEDNGIKKNAT